MDELHLSLGVGLGTPGMARQAVTSLLADVDHDHLDVVALLTSELVTNALVHTTTSTVDLCVRRDGDRVVIEVTDDDYVHADLISRHPSPEENGGRGLAIIEHLADTWGIDVTDETSKTVWARVDQLRGPIIDRRSEVDMA